MIRRALALGSALLLAACAVGPNYRPLPTQPQMQAPFTETGLNQLVSGQPLAANWWEMFRDPALDRLIRDAFAYNTDVRQAAGNLRRARAVLSEARAGRLPTTALSGGYTRARVGADSISAGGTSVASGSTTSAGSGVAGTGTTATTGSATSTGSAAGGTVPSDSGPSHYDFQYFQTGFDASYELDLFGRVSRTIEAARADTEASRAQLQGVQITVAAEVAQAYAAACGYAAQADVARETAQLEGRTLDLTRRLLQAGRGTRRDVDQAAVLVDQATAQVPVLEGERRANLYALATLTGRPPAEVDGIAAVCRAVPKVQTVIPVGDGAALLARRPDVRQAERTLAGDTARIGVATAQLFPTVTLAGSVSLGAPRVGDVGKSRSFSYSFGPLISWSFPNIAVARARIRQARGQADASLAAFQGVMLTALRETEQALARYAAALDQNAALARVLADAEDAARLSNLRFSTGRDTFLDVLVAEQNRASARAALAQSDATVAADQVALFRALGGGWENAPPVATAQAATASTGTP